MASPSKSNTKLAATMDIRKSKDDNDQSGPSKMKNAKGKIVQSKVSRNEDQSVSRFRPGRGGFEGVKLKAQNHVGVRYTAKPIVPAEKAELISVAKAMHRDDFGKRVQETFNSEVMAAKKAIENGHYIGWRCPEYTWDCIRVEESSRCFCGHPLNQHRYFNGTKSQVSCAIHDCRCRTFEFIPSKPEDVGEFWLKKRPGYDPTTWIAKCRCKHTHVQHSPIGSKKCQTKQCRCHQFVSNFLCSACDRHWEDHQTYFETEDIRVANGLPIGEAYLPFAEMPELRNMAMNGEAGNSFSQKSIAAKQSPLALQQNMQDMSLQTPTSRDQCAQINNNTPVPFGYQRPKGSPFD